jgi:hypothetical protein
LFYDFKTRGKEVWTGGGLSGIPPCLFYPWAFTSCQRGQEGKRISLPSCPGANPLPPAASPVECPLDTRPLWNPLLSLSPLGAVRRFAPSRLRRRRTPWGGVLRRPCVVTPKLCCESDATRRSRSRGRGVKGWWGDQKGGGRGILSPSSPLLRGISDAGYRERRGLWLRVY